VNAAHQRRLTPVLVIAAVLLGAVLLLLAFGVGRHARWGARRSMPPLPQAGNAVDLPRAVQLSQFALVWQKPLFNPDRKPIARTVDGGSNLGDLELTGIILTPHLRMALLHDKNGDRQVRVREGESLPDGSIRLVEVRPRSALFDASGGRTELKLPAGAPIDIPKGAADAASREVPGDATLRFQGAAQPTDGNASPPRQPARKLRPGQVHPEEDPSPGAAINRLRQNIQRRRANAAATHEGVR
jgi:general secretion pathway protein N